MQTPDNNVTERTIPNGNRQLIRLATRAKLKRKLLLEPVKTHSTPQ